MIIIKNGTIKLQDIQQFKCHICGCVYELDLCDGSRVLMGRR